MKQKIKLVKAYLNQKCLNDFLSIVVEKHNLIDNWYYIHLAQKDCDKVCKLFVTSSGVVSLEGFANFKVFEVINTINFICDSEYYQIMLRHQIVDAEDVKMRLENK